MSNAIHKTPSIVHQRRLKTIDNTLDSN